MLNTDETPLYLFKNRGRIIVEKSKLSEATWKERDPKLRCTFMPTIQYSRVLGFRPCFVLNIKCTRWTIKPIKVEEKFVIHNGKECKLLRKTYEDFVVYCTQKSWINGPIFQWEMSRLSTFLKLKTPNTKYGLLLDNVPSHVSVKFPNLKLIFLPPNTTSRTQPLDLSVFGTLKNQYSSWLMRETLQNGPEGLNIEKCVRSMATIFKNLDVRSTNHGFSATKLNKFQSEPTLETELSQEERIMNLIESFDRFECSDSDDE